MFSTQVTESGWFVATAHTFVLVLLQHVVAQQFAGVLCRCTLSCSAAAAWLGQLHAAPGRPLVTPFRSAAAAAAAVCRCAACAIVKQLRGLACIMALVGCCSAKQRAPTPLHRCLGGVHVRAPAQPLQGCQGSTHCWCCRPGECAQLCWGANVAARPLLAFSGPAARSWSPAAAT